jgi:type I restriction enzyme S subunit
MKLLNFPDCPSEVQKEVIEYKNKQYKNKSVLHINIEKKYNKIEEIFTTLTTLTTETKLQSTYLSKLRQSILQEAIEGKLTEDWREKNRKSITKGDPNTDAVALLEKIKSEKEKMIAEGKLRKDKPLPAIKKEEIPFVLPEGWVWCRLGEVVNIKSGKRIHVSDYIDHGVPFLRSGEIGSLGRGESLKNILYITKVKYEYIKENFGIPKKEDILIACIGGSIGNIWVVDEREFYFKDGNLVLIEKNNYISTYYLEAYLKSSFFWKNTILTATDTSYNALTIVKLNFSFIPLPPLAEQHAIVEKIESLMKSVDELETQVQERKRYAEDFYSL